MPLTRLWRQLSVFLLCKNKFQKALESTDTDYMVCVVQRVKRVKRKDKTMKKKTLEQSLKNEVSAMNQDLNKLEAERKEKEMTTTATTTTPAPAAPTAPKKVDKRQGRKMSEEQKQAIKEGRRLARIQKEAQMKAARWGKDYICVGTKEMAIEWMANMPLDLYQQMPEWIELAKPARVAKDRQLLQDQLNATKKAKEEAEAKAKALEAQLASLK